MSSFARCYSEVDAYAGAADIAGSAHRSEAAGITTMPQRPLPQALTLRQPLANSPSRRPAALLYQSPS